MSNCSSGKVASMGRVLGDRSTLFKYLNPHAVALAVASDAASTVALHVLDVKTGNVIWTAVESVAPGSADAVSVTLVDNWLVYSVVDQGVMGGHTKLVSVELFTRLGDDTIGRSACAQSSER